MTTLHLSTSELEKFCAGSLAEDEQDIIAVHTANCPSCHQQFVQKLRTAPSVGFSLEPEFWFRNDHLDFESLVALVENTLDDELEEINHIHLKTCEQCREDVLYYETFRQTTDRELIGSYDRDFAGIVTPRFPGIPWKLAYATVAIVIIGLTIVMIYKSRETVKPQLYVHETPVAPATPAPSSDEPVVINDARGEIAIYKDGRVTGVNELSDETRQQIARAALSERVETAAVLKDLAAHRDDLRGGPTLAKQIKLLYPTRSVIIEDQPVFSWKKLFDATSYQVYVLDAHGNEVGRSELLPGTQTKWRVDKRLQRGQLFSWVVAAIVDGKEIISPAASEPEMKFAILSSADLKELNQLKSQKSHLALGVFYARTGLLSSAEREFQMLLLANPQSELTKRLLQSVHRKG